MRRICFALLCLLYSTSLFAQGFLRRQDKTIVNDQGEVLLRGMGLGGWMLQEGYMLQTSAFANPQHQIRAKIEALLGPGDTEAFYAAWRANHCRKVDIDSLAAWGFNSVRLPMHYNLFTLPIEEEPVKGINTWLSTGFDIIDQLLQWCKANRIYLILDLHAAPGGQGKDAAISDYDDSKPSLWESAENRAKTVALWRRIAERYNQEPWIGGYDLINETNWEMSGNLMLRSLYLEITNAIRQVDRNHLIFIEGNWWANDFTGLTPPWDANMAYSFHKYWSTNDKASIQWVLDIRNRHNVPLWCGEAGENSNVWFTDAIRLLEGNNIGWAWWPLKKVESISCPLSISKPAGYQKLLDYWGGSGPRPSAVETRAALTALTENLKLEKCSFQKDVVDALFRQVRSDQVLPFVSHAIPGRIAASDYDLGRHTLAYFDSDVANYQVSTGAWSAWNTGWQYRNDGVDLEACSDRDAGSGFSVGWIAAGEWLSYSAQVAQTGLYEILYRVAAPAAGGVMELYLQEGTRERLLHSVEIPATGGWQTWQTIADTASLSRGDVRLKLKMRQNGFNFNWLHFNLLRSQEEAPTAEIRLDPVYPNPGRTMAHLRYHMDAASTVFLDVYNINGARVTTLAAGLCTAGTHVQDVDLSQLPSGLYWMRLQAGGRTAVRKFAVVR